MILIADSGSTKIDWCVLDGKEMVAQVFTCGMNAMMLTEEEMFATIEKELVPHIKGMTITEVYYYGAGCLFENVCNNVRNAIKRNIPTAEKIEVESDLLAAARALCGDQPGIACIMGTGSNSGLFLRGKMVHNVSPLGYVLGDEGSGAVLGRLLVGDVLKHQLPEEICADFFATYSLTPDEVVRRVYREPMPNRFLASFAPFLHRHRSHPAVHALLLHEFRRFFLRNVAAYGRPDLPIGLVGSIAFYFQEEIAEAATGCGMTIGKVLRAPL